MSFWADNRFLVTGGAGFLGSAVVKQMKALGATAVFVPRQRDYDLRQAEAVSRVLHDSQTTVVIHMAAVVGGIGANMARAAEFFYDNLLIGAQLLHESWRAGVQKFVTIGTVCA